MNFSEFQFGDYGLGATDTEMGKLVMQKFHQAMMNQYGKAYALSFEDLIDRYGDWALDTIGLAANVGGTSMWSSQSPMTESQIASAMTGLAVKGNGAVPTSVNGFTSALSTVASDPYTATNLWNSISYTALETAKQVEEAVEEGGQTLIEVAKTTKDAALFWKNAIWLVPVAIGLVMWLNRKQLADAATGGLYSIGGAAKKRIVKAIEGNQ